MRSAVLVAVAAASVLAVGASATGVAKGGQSSRESGGSALETRVRASVARDAIAVHRGRQRGWEPDFYCLELTDHAADACSEDSLFGPVRPYDPPGSVLAALPTRRPVLPASRCRVDRGVVSGPLKGRGWRLSIGAVDWQARDAALVYVEEEWGPLAASGRVYLVAERDGVWRLDPDYVHSCLWQR